jgi:hypothetical protein
MGSFGWDCDFWGVSLPYSVDEQCFGDIWPYDELVWHWVISNLPGWFHRVQGSECRVLQKNPKGSRFRVLGLEDEPLSLGFVATSIIMECLGIRVVMDGRFGD